MRCACAIHRRRGGIGLVLQVQERFGTSAAKTTRMVPSGMVGLAVRHDALDRNPVRDVSRIESEASRARALTADRGGRAANEDPRE